MIFSNANTAQQAERIINDAKPDKKHGIISELLIQYSLSQDISIAIVGCSTPAEVKTLSDSGREFKPLSDREKSFLLQSVKPNAPRLAYYRFVI